MLRSAVLFLSVTWAFLCLSLFTFYALEAAGLTVVIPVNLVIYAWLVCVYMWSFRDLWVDVTIEHTTDMHTNTHKNYARPKLYPPEGVL